MATAGSTYWTFARVSKLTASGTSVAVISLFTFLALTGNLNVTGHSYTEHCAGTPSDLCYLYINATPTKDIYIQADSQWLNTNPPIKKITLQRSWGSGWRNIDLTKPWSKDVKYALKLTKGQKYQFRFVAEKYRPDDVIEWGINPEGVWDKAVPYLKYDTKEVVYYEPVEHYKSVEQCNTCDETNKSCIVKCYNISVLDYVEQVKRTRTEKVANSNYIQYAEEKVKITDIQKPHTKCTEKGCDKWCESESDIVNGVCTDYPDADGNGVCSTGESDCDLRLVYTDKIEITK